MFKSQTDLSRTILPMIVAGFVALLAVGAASIYLDMRARTFNDLTLLAQEIKTAASEVLSANQDAETGQRGFLLTFEERYLEPYNNAMVNLPKHLDELKTLTSANPVTSAMVVGIEELSARRVGIINSTLDAARNGDREKAVSLISSGEGKAVMDELRVKIAELQTEQSRLLEERSGEVRSTSQGLLIVNLLALLLVLSLGGASVYVVRNYLDELATTRKALEATNAGLEDAVEERAGEIARANEEIQRFAYIVSHDLRAPLVNIMGFTSELDAIGKAFNRQQAIIRDRSPELIQHETDVAIETELPEAIDFIRASTAKMDRLINAILGLSREGRRTLTPARVKMDALAQSIADSMKHQVVEADATIEVAPLPEIITDRLAIEQVMSNLIENAVKYLDRSRSGRIVVRGREDGPFLYYEVEDNGRGIAEKDHVRVFELFRRAGKQDLPGEGLGLAFVQTLVRRLGGSIQLQSEAGRGSTFTLRMPRVLVPRKVEEA